MTSRLLNNKCIRHAALVIGWIAIANLAGAASFDCAMAQSKAEMMICADAELSRLDEAMAERYSQALTAVGSAETLRQQQRDWMKQRNACEDTSCLRNSYESRIVALISPTKPVQKPVASSSLKGEFFLSRNKFLEPVCQRFTHNLNQFRKLDFDTCHPRMSDKYPEFSRPKWAEIPFDLTLAEEVIKGRIVNYRNAPPAAKLAQEYWEVWKDRVRPFVASGQARMWRTRIDLDGDGLEETIIRMVPGQGVDVKLETKPPYSCDYNRGSLHMRDNVHQEISDRFNNDGDSDIVYFAENKRYYRIRWLAAGPAYHDNIGATAGVVVSDLNWNGYLMTGADICLIDWVPTGQYKPLQRSR